MPLWALLARGSFLAAPGHCGRAPGPPPRTPGWLEGLRALWLPHLSKGWQGTESAQSPLPYSSEVAEADCLGQHPQAPELGVERSLPAPPAKQTRSAASRRELPAEARAR